MATMAKGLPPFETYYDEKLKVGYKWYDAEKKPALFPFGFGLSYTTYSYSGRARPRYAAQFQHLGDLGYLGERTCAEPDRCLGNRQWNRYLRRPG